MRAVDVVQPDVCYLGGINRTLKVVEMAPGVTLEELQIKTGVPLLP